MYSDASSIQIAWTEKMRNKLMVSFCFEYQSKTMMVWYTTTTQTQPAVSWESSPALTEEISTAPYSVSCRIICTSAVINCILVLAGYSIRHHFLLQKSSLTKQQGLHVQQLVCHVYAILCTEAVGLTAERGSAFILKPKLLASN